MAKTKKPTGLSIRRENDWFILKWKCGDSNYSDGQSFQYRTNLKGWTGISIGKGAREQWVKIGASGNLQWVEMRVKGNRKKYKKKNKTINPSASDWASARYTLQAPRVPEVTAKMDEVLANVCVFSWVVTTSSSDANWFTKTQYESMLVKDSDVSDGSKLAWNSSQLGWQSGDSTAENNVRITEDTSVIVDGSYTRWFRVKSYGARGSSEWAYERHVYGLSYQANVLSAVATIQEAGGFQCKVIWEAPSSESHPIDKTTVEYTITEPEAGLQCPDSASWTSAKVSEDTSDKDAVAFPIDRLLSPNTCLFVRVNTEHDGVITYGLPVLAEGGVGVLSNPTLTRVELGQDYRVTVTATNSSPVEDSFLVILYRPASDPSREIVIGTMDHGETSKNVQAPDWSDEEAFAFGIYAAVGDPDTITHDSATMKSDIVWGEGDVPKAPASVNVSQTAITGTIRVEWEWTWQDATGAELSWADHEDAWESTDEPDTYEVSSIYNSKWNISGLATGQKWYVRVRLKKGSGDSATYGPYSEIKEIDLTSAPSIPTLVLSSGVITENGSVTASWVYTTTDGTGQGYAEICEAEITSGGITHGSYKPTDDIYPKESVTYYELSGDQYVDVENIVYPDPEHDVRGDNPAEEGWYVYRETIARVQTAQHITLNAKDMGWETGHTYNLCVRVISSAGRVSDEWSAPVSIMIADPLQIEITESSLVDDSEQVVVEGETVTREFKSLIEMPLTLTVSGAGDNGNVSVIVERDGSYHIDRPDETDYTGYDKETIALQSRIGDGEIEISDLIGSFDDGASYRLIATVQDDLGQSAETSVEFEVHWEHQAKAPEGTVQIDTENMIAKIQPIAPKDTEDWQIESGDVCDIYRLSTDRPELIVKDGIFGETYVDPFATIGQFGGYRLVFRTANGDYITEENEIAWIDLVEEILEVDYTIIDFDGGRIMLEYNVDVSSSWDKDFQETQYLGGSVQGDWNVAVSRTSSVSAVAITLTDADQIEMVRRLAVSPQICHVRTKDGSSYAADVQVKESHPHDKYGQVVSYSFDITRVDTEELDGMTLAQWNELNNEEE